jgi:hypothetical protein
MTASPWYVDVDFSVANPLPEEIEFDVLDAVRDYSPAMSVWPDRVRASLSVAVEAESAPKAAATTEEIVASLNRLLGASIVTAIDVQSEEARRMRDEDPRIPDLVGYAEIADMAGVSRQRAREIAHLAGFPVAVVETTAGPLRVKAAVESWLANWERKPGRPRKLTSV